MIQVTGAVHTESGSRTWSLLTPGVRFLDEPTREEVSDRVQAAPFIGHLFSTGSIIKKSFNLLRNFSQD
jgi:hypothetical protein